MLSKLSRTCALQVPNIRFNVAKMLERLVPLLEAQVTDQSVRPVLQELTEDPDTDVRFYASQALVRGFFRPSVLSRTFATHLTVPVDERLYVLSRRRPAIIGWSARRAAERELWSHRHWHWHLACRSSVRMVLMAVSDVALAERFSGCGNSVCSEPGVQCNAVRASCREPSQHPSLCWKHM